MCAYQIKTLFIAVHVCSACCVALSASVLWPLRPVASVLTHNTPVSALMERLFWMSGFGFGRGQGLGKQTLCWGTVSPETRGKNAQKKEHSERGPKPPNLHFFPVCLGAGGTAKGLGTDDKTFCGTLRKPYRGAALKRGSLPTPRRSAHAKLVSQLFHLKTQLFAQRHGLPQSVLAIVLLFCSWALAVRARNGVQTEAFCHPTQHSLVALPCDGHLAFQQTARSLNPYVAD